MVVVVRRQHFLEEVAKEFQAYCAKNVIVSQVDLTKPQGCKRIVEFTVFTFGRCMDF
jgi:short-subunit dehydrogenase